jgi:hypothetical protein
MDELLDWVSLDVLPVPDVVVLPDVDEVAVVEPLVAAAPLPASGDAMKTYCEG